MPADSGRIAERAVAVVAQQLIRSELGDIQIDAAVVVVVAGRGAHAVAAHVDAALFGDVGEASGVPDRRSARDGSLRNSRELNGLFGGDNAESISLAAEHVALNDEHIEIAVVVEVEQRDARRHDFRVIEVAGHAVEVREG